MGLHTNIEWADSTVNGVMGCDGCELWRPARRNEPGAVQRTDGSWWILICYAGTITTKILRNGHRAGWPVAFDIPTLFPGRIEATARWKDLTGTPRADKPQLNGMPRVIFCDDMGDRWTASLPIDSLAPTLPVIAKSPHLYLFLTKRADRAVEFSRAYALPDNVWLGTSITSAQAARLRALERAKASVLFVSYEPVLADASQLVRQHPGIRWWIFGGASGPHAPPTDVRVIRDGLAACRDTGASAFVKQVGSQPRGWCAWEAHDRRPPHWLDVDGVLPSVSGAPAVDLCHAVEEYFWPCAPKLKDRKGGAPEEWPADLRVREFPR